MKTRHLILCLLYCALFGAAPPASAETPSEPIRILAAGSLRNALNELITQWQKEHPEKPAGLTSGPAGWLRERIEHGEAFDIYASAAMGHAEAIHRQGLGGHPVLFAKNSLCATVRADAPVDTNTVVAYLLQPEIRLATSTPVSDPGGDYTWRFFRGIDEKQPGAYQILNDKAQQLYGGAPAPNAPRINIPEQIADGKLDISLGYCSGKNTNPALKRVALPPPSPTADYAFVLANQAPRTAMEFALFMLSPSGQRVLATHGFQVIGLPSE